MDVPRDERPPDLAEGPDSPSPEEIADLLPTRLQQIAEIGLLEA